MDDEIVIHVLSSSLAVHQKLMNILNYADNIRGLVQTIAFKGEDCRFFD